MKLRLAIVGAGYSGLRALESLHLALGPSAQVTVVDGRTGGQHPPLASATDPRAQFGMPVFLRGDAGRIDPVKREVLLEDGRFIGFDAVLMAIGAPVPPGHGVVARSGFGDEAGLIPTDRCMRHPAHPNLYAIGACAAPPVEVTTLDDDERIAIAVRALTRDVGRGGQLPGPLRPPR